ncbi:MAG: DNA-binding protein [Candidatus Norongarragalinales archaeon]
MKFRKEKNCFIIKFEPGEEVVESLKKFCAARKIKGGFVTGIGAAKQATLGVFDVRRKQYWKKTLEGDLEIASLSGSVSELGPHLHSVIAGRDFTAVGGHVLRLVTSVTCELFVFPTRAIKRVADERFNLKLMKL